MRIITAANREYADLAIHLCEGLEALGEMAWIYDIGGMPDNKYSWCHSSFNPFRLKVKTEPEDLKHSRPEGFSPALFKIRAILHALRIEDFVLWVDADCEVVQRVDELEEWVDTIGVCKTLEGDVHPCAGGYGAGVIAATRKGIPIVEEWLELAKAWRSDQGALCDGIRNRGWPVHVLDGAVYNNYYFDQDQSKAKILHYLGKDLREMLRRKISEKKSSVHRV